MAARKLGGGRILGSGRSLSPAQPPRNSSLLSPSTSSVSVSSSISTSQPSTDAQDLSSRISLDQSDDSNNVAATAAAASRLVCPICNEDMVGVICSGENGHADRKSRLRCSNSIDISTTITRILKKSNKTRSKIGSRRKWSKRNASSPLRSSTRNSKDWTCSSPTTPLNHPTLDR